MSTAIGRREQAQLLQAITGATDAEACPDLFADSDSGDADADPLTVSELSGGKRLVAARCWLAAYNYGVGYWVINARAPYEPTEVTLDGTGYELGQIVTAQKGRGVGDCWYAEAWAWNGHAFVAVGEHTTGLCRGLGGGAWTLPTLVTELR